MDQVVDIKRFNNPHRVNMSSGVMGTHYYVMPVYKTSALLCTQCLRAQDSPNHTTIGPSRI